MKKLLSVIVKQLSDNEFRSVCICLDEDTNAWHLPGSICPTAGASAEQAFSLFSSDNWIGIGGYIVDYGKYDPEI